MNSGELLFKISDTHGLPVEIAVEKLLEKNIQIDWFRFCLTAANAGWSNKKIKEKIKSAMQDLIGYDEYKNGLLERIDLLLN